MSSLTAEICHEYYFVRQLLYFWRAYYHDYHDYVPWNTHVRLARHSQMQKFVMNTIHAIPRDNYWIIPCILYSRRHWPCVSRPDTRLVVRGTCTDLVVRDIFRLHSESRATVRWKSEYITLFLCNDISLPIRNDSKALLFICRIIWYIINAWYLFSLTLQ